MVSGSADWVRFRIMTRNDSRPMDVPSTSTSSPTSATTALAKVVADLDLLVRALLTSLPSSKPWQRRLRVHLTEPDRLLQVLRMTVAMGRSSGEVEQAAAELLKALRLANVYVNGGRADMGTKHAIQLAFSLGQQICVAVADGGVGVVQE